MILRSHFQLDLECLSLLITHVLFGISNSKKLHLNFLKVWQCTSDPFVKQTGHKNRGPGSVTGPTGAAGNLLHLSIPAISIHYMRVGALQRIRHNSFWVIESYVKSQSSVHNGFIHKPHTIHSHMWWQRHVVKTDPTGGQCHHNTLYTW